MHLPHSFSRLACAAMLAVLTLFVPTKSATAGEYSDLWVTPGEDAWGVNFVQWGNIIFATFYIYGPDNKPIWYTAVLSLDGAGNYTGILYANIGTYFALPWRPSDHIESVVGTATFQPSTVNSYQGTLVYAVNGVGTITKLVQRLPNAAPIPSMSGTYYGGQVGSYSGCTDDNGNGAYQDYFPLQVTQSAGNASISLSFAYTSGLTCTLAGPLTQNSLLYSIGAATYTCVDDTGTTTNAAALSDLKLTAQGIEGRFSSTDLASNCREDARFSAVRN
jgi:hypothetical protein